MEHNDLTQKHNDLQREKQEDHSEANRKVYALRTKCDSLEFAVRNMQTTCQTVKHSKLETEL
jgi:hypothetical protein